MATSFYFAPHSRNLNVRIVEALAEYSTVLQSVPDAGLLTMFDLDFGDVFPHVFCTMCDTWRRMKLPSERGWVKLLGICFMSVEEASMRLQTIAAADCQCCNGDQCTMAALAITNNGTNLEMVKEIMNLFGETIYHLPASSVNVEKLHANTQILCSAHKAGRKPATIQQNTYIMSCSQEHKKLKDELLTETFGKQKVTSSKLLRQRVASTTMPSQPVTHFNQRRQPRGRNNVATLNLHWGSIRSIFFLEMMF